ncbi:cocaine- and amphetamine-regulated transcript protein-like [Anabas testudineus]|uniref:cocaine- and amphetamine-regulated transcript protein-like n=1 Tax=Anabas testudineus TaxID=64144 RepID=UPI000E458B00|nr:cocaine- and amphetamine-regulated transcript protein-like [Anabas testudineus]XP_026227374.1 cocaine- and amphetamine-regulated transcript protein-like [Anabas testudineus]
MNTPASIFIILLCLLLLRSTTVTGSRWTEEKTTGEKSEDSRELLIVLHNVLEKLQSRKLSTLDSRQSRLPMCEVGALCSVKKGPRFGQLCDCHKGSRCNYVFLKCL